MRILVISNLYPPSVQGGYELGCAHVVRELLAAGHEVQVLTSGESGGEPGVNRALRVFPVFDPATVQRATPKERHSLAVHARLFAEENDRVLARELDAFQPDVAYLWNLLGVGGLSMLGRLELQGLPWVWHLMDAVPRHLCTVAGETDPTLCAALTDASMGRFLACSTHVLGEIAAGGVSLPGPVDLVPNWLAGQLPAPRTSFFGDERDCLRVLCAVGVLVEHKGIDILIEATARTQAALPDALLVDIFGREDDDRFRTLASQRGVAGIVRFGGLLAQGELLGRLAEYDVFAFPTAWREPFAFAPLEAAAAGCVPLISENSGNAEWMVGGVHCLKAARSAEAFATRLSAIARREVDLAPVARRGQAVVREMFHLPALMRRIEFVLEDAAAAEQRLASDRLFKVAVSTAERLLNGR